MTGAPSSAAARLPEALQRVRDLVADAPLLLEVPGRDEAGRTARSVVEQVDDYLLPRLRDLNAPLLAVVGGSTGAGKSTLVNSVLGGEPVTTAGVLRPTTRAPVLVCSPADLASFSGDRVLPGLARSTGSDPGAAGSGALRVTVRDDLPPGLALLDAPDVDSVVEANRDLAGQLLAAADLWLFVTTAARYADAVPWDLLRTAEQRGTSLAVVLDRVPPEASAEVAEDLRRMLREAGLSGARVFVVEERPLVDGRLPEDQVAGVREWLRGIAQDAGARAEVVRRTLTGALASLDQRVGAVVGAVQEQQTAADRLRRAADDAWSGAVERVDESVRGGALLRGEVLSRWQEFVGTGEWMRSLQAGVGRLRDRVVAGVTGRSTPGDALGAALEDSVETMLRAQAETASERTVAAWRALPGGACLLAGRDRALETVTAGFDDRAARTVRDWQGHVLELVRDQGGRRRSVARVLSLGVNGAGLVVMVGVFAHTGGLSGGEIAVAGGTTAVGQRVLEAVLGDEGVRRLAELARQDLVARSQTLLATERQRFDDLVGSADPGAAAAGLHRALAELTAARQP